MYHDFFPTVNTMALKLVIFLTLIYFIKQNQINLFNCVIYFMLVRGLQQMLGRPGRPDSKPQQSKHGSMTAKPNMAIVNSIVLNQISKFQAMHLAS